MLSFPLNNSSGQFSGRETSLEDTANFAVWYRRGEVLASLGHYSEALRNFEEALALESDNCDALLYAAVCLIHLQRPHEALVRCDRILAQVPSHTQAWMFRGVALHRLGHYSESYTCYSRATGSPVRNLGQQLGRSIREKLMRLGILI
ncbi:MAG TPA: tetratricopeptide repeat protein [Leptolyngbyaceae cyanobacterium]